MIRTLELRVPMQIQNFTIYILNETINQLHALVVTHDFVTTPIRKEIYSDTSVSTVTFICAEISFISS